MITFVLGLILGAASSYALLRSKHSKALKESGDKLTQAYDELRRTKGRLHLALNTDEVAAVAREREALAQKLVYLERKLLEDPTREKEMVSIQAENVNLRSDLAFWKAVAKGEKKLPAWDEDAPVNLDGEPCPHCQGRTFHATRCASLLAAPAPLDS